MPDSAQNAGQTPPPADDQRGPRIVHRPRRRSALIDRMVLKHGSDDAAMNALAQKNIRQSETIATLTAERDALKAKVPAHDAVVLTGDDAKHWPTLKALNLPADKIAERVKKADELEGTVTAQQHRERIKTVADAAGMNDMTLAPLLDTYKLDVELRPITVQKSDGSTETKQVAHVRNAGDDKAAWEPLTDFVKKDGSPLKPFAAALAKQGQQGQQGHQTISTGIEFPPQTGHSTSPDAGRSALDKLLAQNAERAKIANPLTAQPTTHVTPIVGGVPSHALPQSTQGKQKAS